MMNDVMLDSDYLRPQKAQRTYDWYQNFQLREDIGHSVYGNAVVLPLKRFQDDNLMFGRGGVIDASGEYIENSAIKNRVEGTYAFQNAEYRNETAVYCGYLVEQWGHFLIEAVTRLWFFLEQDKPEYRYIFIIESGENRAVIENYEEFLRLLGMQGRIELINQATRFREVIIPDLSFNYLEFYSSKYQLIFEKVIDTALHMPTSELGKPKRLFLSRSAFKKACNSEYGLELLDNFFRNNGFDIIYPEQYSLAEMIILMENADTIASESGSLSHNMLFCDYGKEFIIIERQTIINRVQTSIDCVKKPRITYIDADMMIYPVVMGSGPFLMLYNNWFEKFVREKNYNPPDPVFTSKKYLKDNLRKYLRKYFELYYLGCGVSENQKVFYELLFEGYNDTRELLGKYLDGQEPFCKEQLIIGKFSIIRRIKRTVLRAIGKLRRLNLVGNR